MYGIVLGTRMCLEINVIIALHTENGLNAQYRIQIWVFTTRFLSSAPTRVTEDIDVRTPERQFGIAWIIRNAHRDIENIMV